MERKEIVIFIVMVMLWWSIGNCLTFDSTVAKDGSGKYKTIIEALNAAPKRRSRPYYIHIKRGIYNENVTIPDEKTNIVFVGDGMGLTIITSSKCHLGTYDTATLEVFGSGFIGMKMTIRNTAGAIGGQAAALTSAPYHGVASYYQCRFEGYQDTIFAHVGFAFFRECYISGTIDFISGDGRAIFQNSAVIARTPLHGQGIRILAPGADNITPKPGLVLQNCTISTEPGFDKSVSSFLGWAWKNQGRGVIMSSYINDFIDPQGWLSNSEVKDIYFGEYNNRGAGSNTKGRVKWSRVMTKLKASKFTARNFMQGDKWIPKIIPHYLDHLEDAEG